MNSNSSKPPSEADNGHSDPIVPHDPGKRKTRSQKRADRPKFLQFGTGIRLASELWYLEQLGGLLTHTQFRTLCRAIGVPLVKFNADTCYVEMARFELALAAVTRLGSKDFKMPGYTPTGACTKLDAKETADNIEQLVYELWMAKKLNTVGMSNKARESIRAAADKVAESVFLHIPRTVQDELRSTASQEMQDASPLP